MADNQMIPAPKLNEGVFTSATDEWGTPPDLFAYYHRIYGFELDVCASAENAKCAQYFDRKANGLMQEWAPAKCWMNPPYGNGISEWVRKAYQESRRGALVVCLLPARVDTGWWHDYAAKGRMEFLRSRVAFVGTDPGQKGHNAPFPSAIVTFMPADKWELLPYAI
jgi:phage N-6-adenine-methyltransferase